MTVRTFSSPRTSGFLLRIGAALLLVAGLSATARAEEGRAPETLAVPGERYGASWPYRMFFGGSWRDDWTTPILVPRLDLSTFDGGLTPVRRGGGLQTESLRLKSANGQTWVFRSVDKDPRRMFDPETRDSKAAELLRDWTSTAHPTAALVVAPLLEAAGVLHATPQLFVMPDDPRLAEFREFAGMLGMLELRPGRGFAGADKALGSLELFERLDGRTDERVDARAYLRARLMDMFVGDWDRHQDQWRWLRFREGSERIWRPVPRDRDQAFASFDGVLPSVGEYYVKQFASFDERYPPIEKLTFSGRYTDRRFLVALDEADWRAVTAEVVARLTDETIAAAVRRLPPELHAREGAKLEATLRARRDGLPAASEEFYRLLAHQVDVYGTEGDDVASLRWVPDGVEVVLSEADANGTPAGPPYFRRFFRASETSEIRLYLLGGADRVAEDGHRGERIQLRVVTHDPARSESQHAGLLGERDPDPSSESAEPEDDQDRLRLKYERFRDWGTDSLVFPVLSYDATKGLFAGARLERTHFGFGREPYADRMTLAAAWSTGLGEPRLEYTLDVRTRSPFGVLAYAAYSGVEFANFHGYGNESTRDTTLAGQSFYRVNQHRFTLRPLVTASLVGPLRARAGFGFEHFSNSAHAPDSPASGAYGSGDMGLVSAELGLRVDTRAGTLTRKHGFEADVSVRHYPAWVDNAAQFTKARAEVGALLGTRGDSGLLLALRVAGEKNWGRYPFFEAASIGGIGLSSPLLGAGGGGNMLRGYVMNRFAGDASVVANSELRVPLGRYSDIVPLQYGVLALGDVGRVFVNGESSSKWHPAAGGGAWIALHATGSGMELISTTSFTVVRSDEGTAFYISSTFGF